MARPKEFDKEQALDAAMDLFREHGYEGTSAGMLVRSMKIGRQSLYDTFGDKWQLYLSALQRYGSSEALAHLDALSQGGGLAGIRALLERVVRKAHRECLGISSICEFGRREPEISKIHLSVERVLRPAIAECVRDAQQVGDVSIDLDPDFVVTFLVASITGIRVSARSGAPRAHLESLKDMALRALR